MSLLLSWLMQRDKLSAVTNETPDNTRNGRYTGGVRASDRAPTSLVPTLGLNAARI